MKSLDGSPPPKNLGITCSLLRFSAVPQTTHCLVILFIECFQVTSCHSSGGCSSFAANKFTARASHFQHSGETSARLSFSSTPIHIQRSPQAVHLIVRSYVPLIRKPTFRSPPQSAVCRCRLNLAGARSPERITATSSPSRCRSAGILRTSTTPWRTLPGNAHRACG